MSIASTYQWQVDEVLAQVVHCNTSNEVWTALNSASASQSRSKAVQVCSQLATVHKGGQTASEYFMLIKWLTDELAIAGQEMKCDDIITYLLVILGPEYDFLDSTISHMDGSIILEEAYSMLLTCKARIQHNHQAIIVPNATPMLH
ncbi:unnamed protein product [Fraxinus pennsylvanica]|uniref:Uncharacterized protein n=1 Tax=Fraxinus pennsylvanica TaxID=56036 RepID=A0AAD2DST7_9LAMI|nr:unnamed protein product [Fraxinus pennsylvanica]